MSNLTEKLANVSTFEEMEVITKEYNKAILDNVEISLDKVKLEKEIARVNKLYESAHTDNFIILLEKDRTNAFEFLLTTPTFSKIAKPKYNNNGTITIKKDSSLFRFENLENEYQLFKSNEFKKDGKTKKKNESVSIFGCLRYQTLCQAFIRNIVLKTVSDIDTDITRVKIDGTTIFTEKDGVCFTKSSKNGYTEQLQLLTKFYGLDVTMYKEDVLPISVDALKSKRDKNNFISLKEIDYLKATDIIFSTVTTRFAKKGIVIKLADGTETTINTETKTETETVTE